MNKLAIILITGLISYSPLFAQDYKIDVNTVINDLRALNSVVETGTTYLEYSRRVSDTKIKVDEFLRKYENKESDIKIFVNDAINYYITAKFAWQVTFNNGSGYREVKNSIYWKKMEETLKKEIKYMEPQPLWQMAELSIVSIELLVLMNIYGRMER